MIVQHNQSPRDELSCEAHLTIKQRIKSEHISLHMIVQHNQSHRGELSCEVHLCDQSTNKIRAHIVTNDRATRSEPSWRTPLCSPPCDQRRIKSEHLSLQMICNHQRITSEHISLPMIARDSSESRLANGAVSIK